MLEPGSNLMSGPFGLSKFMEWFGKLFKDGRFNEPVKKKIEREIGTKLYDKVKKITEESMGV